MKRFKSLAALLLALSMTVALCACGDKQPEEENTDDPGQSQTDVQDPAQDQQSPEQGAQTQGADLEALKAQFIQDYQYSDYVDLDTAHVSTVYALNADQVVSAAAFNATAGGAFPHEVVMIQAASEEAAKAIEISLTEHLDGIAMQAASYDPESEALAKACTPVVSGCYVGLFFTDHNADMTQAFQSAVS